MKREKLHLQSGMTVETGKDTNGRFFIAHARGASMFLRDSAQVRKFLQLAAKTPSRESLDSWFASLGLADRESNQEAKAAEPTLSAEHWRTGFGPECHLDENGLDIHDPNYLTRTVI